MFIDFSSTALLNARHSFKPIIEKMSEIFPLCFLLTKYVTVAAMCASEREKSDGVITCQSRQHVPQVL